MDTGITIADPDLEELPGEPGGLVLLVMSLEAFSSFPLPPTGSVTIGRSSDCEIRLEDPLASRRHARLHLTETIEIEDLSSANGTRVKDALIPNGSRCRVAVGETISVGSTVLVVQTARLGGGLPRVASHRWFEGRLREQCARQDRAEGGFALVRLRFDEPLIWHRAIPLIDQHVRLPDLFAAYGPQDYEILLFETNAAQAAEKLQGMLGVLKVLGIPTRAGIAAYPRNGRTADALMAAANQRLRPQSSAAPETFRPGDPSMQEVERLATRAAKSTINVLILGETGVGKEVMANLVHRHSPRAGGPFLALNCAGITESLIESELFGYEKGAFTGAVQARRGLLEAASGGTLFLDEVGEMPPSVQPRLLRAIANREILPVGATKPRPIDVRILAATNRNLEEEVAKGNFRQDLYYRLNSIVLEIPPLRERRGEIPVLCQAFLQETAQGLGREPPALSPRAAELFQKYGWPGNIRELRNVIERAVVLCEGDQVDLEHLPVSRMQRPTEQARPVETSGGTSSTMLIPAAPADLNPTELGERKQMIEALAKHVWNQSRAAKYLGMSRRTFSNKLTRFNIPRPQKPACEDTPGDDTPD